jgi:Flp pilus assembly protein TadG
MRHSMNCARRPRSPARLLRITLLRSADGQSIYEVALMLPVLLAVLIGILYGGMTFYNYVTLESAVAAGARTLATSRLLPTESAAAESPCTAAQNMIYSVASKLKQSSINVTFTFLPSTDTCTTIKNGATVAGFSVGDTVIVTATYPCNLKVPIIGIRTIDVCPAGDVLTSKTEMRAE